MMHLRMSLETNELFATFDHSERRITTMQRETKLFISTLLIAVACATRTGLVADDQQARDEKKGQRRIGLLDWHTNYLSAYEQARAEQKQLLIFFRDETKPCVADNYESRVLASDKLWTPLSQYVRAVLPLDTPEPLAKGEEDQVERPKRLVDHQAFVYMNKRQGIAVIDLAEPKTKPYGFVTSAHPFTPGRYYSAAAMQTVLGLPHGTLTQRTLLYALRMHPEQPRYPNSGMNGYLSEQAKQASSVMAQLEQVGHHNWGYRFQTITSALGRPVSEVAASGNGETLVDAAVSCVAAWRGSPAHWQMINNNPLFYGYDLVRGRSGQWYATGILGSGR
ncbi:MAG: hypothetical protein WD648_06780 [Planctomycetaceae bacterium]